MATDREIALEQSLIALLGAAMANDVDDNALVARASGLILGNGKFRTADHPYVSMSVQELADAHAKALEIAATDLPS